MKDFPTSAPLDFHLESLSYKTQSTPQPAVDSTAAVPLQVEEKRLREKKRSVIEKMKEKKRFAKGLADQLGLDLKKSLNKIRFSEFEGQIKC